MIGKVEGETGKVLTSLVESAGNPAPEKYLGHLFEWALLYNDPYQ